MSILLKTTLFFLILINPISKVAILSMLGTKIGKNRRELDWMVVKASVVALILLVIFAFGGRVILKDIFQINPSALYCAGGIVLAIMGWRALDRGMFFDLDKNKSLLDIAIVPLASPLIAGPATISATIVKAADLDPLTVSLALACAIVLNLLIVLVAVRLIKLLEKYNIISALIRITGLFIMSMGVHMVFYGIMAYVISIKGLMLNM